MLCLSLESSLMWIGCSSIWRNTTWSWWLSNSATSFDICPIVFATEPMWQGLSHSVLPRKDHAHRPLSRRLDRCDRVIQNESRDPFGGNVYYVTMQITFLTRKFRNKERNLHCDIVHITTKWVSSITIDCNGVFAIKAYYACTVFDVITELFAYVIMGQKNAATTEPPWTLNDVPR